MAFGGERKEEEGGRAVTPPSPSPSRQERGLLWGGERDQEIIKRRKGTIMGAIQMAFYFPSVFGRENRGLLGGKRRRSECFFARHFLCSVFFSCKKIEIISGDTSFN